ncbi:MAG: alpha-glucuronidase family glycosyl hydrolase [Paludibacter sp.]|nr:alpha-glucuronidase family glycosyl hydrolase [Paludibacter sp.]
MIRNLLFYILLLLAVSGLNAENGHQLWLRFNKTKIDSQIFSGIIGDKNQFAVNEFQHDWNEMTGKYLPMVNAQTDSLLIIGTLNDKNIRPFGLKNELMKLGEDGYVIKTIHQNNKIVTIVASAGESGLLYGVFHLLRLIQIDKFSYNIDIVEKPSYKIRVLDHWDNLDGSVERGYAGRSIWKWDELPNVISPLYKEYARANASIGINGTVLNNVNASPKILSPEYLQKVKAIADQLRPFHIKVYFSINFASPSTIGGLKTSDPLDLMVKKWWNDKANEIYKLIPDFGGFLVKASSEGQPGPQDFGRTHADGANMLADALKPHGGIVMWRAFVYSASKDDRAKQAYNEFVPLDGQFKDNVIIQVKNGPIDFQPREPFSPLFGAMKKTSLMPEVEITQEYLGHSIQLVYLSTMWEEFLKSDTYQEGIGSTVARTTDGSIFPQKYTAIAGVANIGLDSNWCGHQFAQANWYAFGRLAWNNKLTSDQIADEWLRLTFSPKEKKAASFTNTDWEKNFLTPVKQIMLESREAAIHYSMPLGLHHIFAGLNNTHYGPGPWWAPKGVRVDWTPPYYHKADTFGIGFDRTHSGSDAVSQYHEPLCSEFNDVNTCPEIYLLWFHHLPWDYKMKDGRILWDELCYTYEKGLNEVRQFQKTWDKVEPYVDSQRFFEVQSKLRRQCRDAQIWKDGCLLYFQQFSKRPIPYDIERPVHDLDDLMKIKLNLKDHN